MDELLHFHYDVDGTNFTSAGEASVQVKRLLRQMGFSPDLIRRISIAMYEAEINMVIPYAVFHFVLSGEGYVNGKKVSSNMVFISLCDLRISSTRKVSLSVSSSFVP